MEYTTRKSPIEEMGKVNTERASLVPKFFKREEVGDSSGKNKAPAEMAYHTELVGMVS